MAVVVAHLPSPVFQRRMPEAVVAQAARQVTQTVQIQRQLVLAVRAAAELVDRLVVESELQVLRAPSTQVLAAAAVVTATTQTHLLPVVPADQDLSLFAMRFRQYRRPTSRRHQTTAHLPLTTSPRTAH